MKLNKIRIFLLAILGGVSGYLILHPYSMLAYSLHGAGQGWEDFFRPGMFHMGVPYAAFGAACGVFLGLWLEARRRREEAEKKALTLDTLRQLVVTLSHYLLNAATVTGGYAGLLLKNQDDPKTRYGLEVIRGKSREIEEIINSLQAAESVASEHYTKDGEAMLIDIKADLEKRLAALKENERGI